LGLRGSRLYSSSNLQRLANLRHRAGRQVADVGGLGVAQPGNDAQRDQVGVGPELSGTGETEGTTTPCRAHQ